MKRHDLRSFTLFALALALGSASTFAQRVDVRGVSRGAFGGWSDALVMESKDASAKAVFLPSLGARILFYGIHGENILWTNPNAAGQVYKPGDAPFDPGGFACGIGPEVAGLPDHPMTLLGAYTWSTKKKALITAKGQEDKAIGVEMEKEVAYDPTSGELGFVHRIKNISERDGAFSLWHRIACQPGGYAFFPLNKKSRFTHGWSIRKSDNGKLSYEGTNPESPSVRVIDGVLVAHTTGSATKIGGDSDAQWLAYVRGRTLFILHFPHYSGAIYSEGGNSVTVAWDDTKTELQPMGPEARLRSRKSAELAMKWSLVELPSEITSHEQARGLVEKIPSSPFL